MKFDSVRFCITIFVTVFFCFCITNFCYSFSFMFVILFVNMLCVYHSEMASPSTPVNPIPNHGEKTERFNGIDFKR